jgi:Patatin-like phospholipase
MPTDARWKLWGPLEDRYRKTERHRALALDGGGIRGIMTLQVLARLEELLRSARKAGPGFRLCDFFDVIAGTSTGAIIAAALARGMSVAEVTEFYQSFGRLAFTKRSLFERWKALYDNGPLEQKLKEVFGADTTLEPQHLKCMLLVVTRNLSTDSAWPILSNPWAKYCDPARPDCNLKVPLWKIVRASTAAPVYFPPEVIQWNPTDPGESFVFVDGGTTAYNNPAFLLSRMVTEPAYQLGWPRGERNLLVVSIGTGTTPAVGSLADDPESNLLSSATNTLSGLMTQASVDQDMNCRTIGRCTYGRPIDSEVDDLIPRDAPDKPVPLQTDLGKAFLYARYDTQLTRKVLTGLQLADIDPEKARKLDSIDAIGDLERIGQAVAREVSLDHLGPFVTN